jgi:hypothetical protein
MLFLRLRTRKPFYAAWHPDTTLPIPINYDLPRAGRPSRPFCKQLVSMALPHPRRPAPLATPSTVPMGAARDVAVAANPGSRRASVLETLAMALPLRATIARDIVLAVPQGRRRSESLATEAASLRRLQGSRLGRPPLPIIAPTSLPIPSIPLLLPLSLLSHFNRAKARHLATMTMDHLLNNYLPLG